MEAAAAVTAAATAVGDDRFPRAAKAVEVLREAALREKAPHKGAFS
jgi:hypothetical protein